jgi:hypothetical protein
MIHSKNVRSWLKTGLKRVKAMSEHDRVQQVTAQLGLVLPQSTNSEQEKRTVNQKIEVSSIQLSIHQCPNSTKGNDSSSHTVESRAQSKEVQDPEIQKLKEKYKNFVESNLKRQISDKLEAVFGWIYKLQDRECQDSRKVENSERPFIHGLQTYLQNVDDQILGLRKHLADLQMTTVELNTHVIH